MTMKPVVLVISREQVEQLELLMQQTNEGEVHIFQDSNMTITAEFMFPKRWTIAQDGEITWDGA